MRNPILFIPLSHLLELVDVAVHYGKHIVGSALPDKDNAREKWKIMMQSVKD